MEHDPRAATRLARVLAETDVDARALASRAHETESLLAAWTSSGSIERAELVLVAVNLHGYYTALETLLERVARLVDESSPSGPAWHVELVRQMQIEVPGLRPAVVDPAAAPDLHELRKFRHFFRNAYVVEFDEEICRAHAERVLRVHPLLTASMARFRRHVEDVLGRLSG